MKHFLIYFTFVGICLSVGSDIIQMKGGGALSVLDGWADLSSFYKDNYGVEFMFVPMDTDVAVQGMYDRTLDYIVLDSLPNTTVLNGGEIIILPIATSPLVMVYNIPGLQSQPVFSATMLVDIFSGFITDWDDARIGQDFPDAKINVILPAHDTGLTYQMTTFLHLSDPSFPEPFTTTQGWPSTLSAVYVASVADTVASQPYTIGYVSYNLALGSGLSAAAILNLHNIPSFPSSLVIDRGADRCTLDSNNVVYLDTKDYPYAYPILTTIYMGVPAYSGSCEFSNALLDLYLWLIGGVEVPQLMWSGGVVRLPWIYDNPQLIMYKYFRCTENNQILPGGKKFLAWSGGSSSTYPLLTWLLRTWTYELGFVPGLLHFEPLTSSEGIDRFRKGTLQLAITDVMLSKSELQAGLVQVPIAGFGIAMIYNLPGLGTTDYVVLERSVLVGIFSGIIKYWDDQDIRRLNTFLMLPHEPITLVLRHNDSGTTLFMTQALSLFSNVWQVRYGKFSHESKWPEGLNAIYMQSDGHVSRKVHDKAYHLGFCSYSQAVYEGNSIAMVLNAAGNNVSPQIEAVKETVDKLTLDSNLQLDIKDLMDGTGTGAYPINGLSYYVFPRHMFSHQLKANSPRAPDGCDVAKLIMGYIFYSLRSTEGKSVTRTNHYAYPPSSSDGAVLDILYSTTCDGKLLLTRPKESSGDSSEDSFNWTAFIAAMAAFGGVLFIAVIIFIFFLMIQRKKMAKTLIQVRIQTKKSKCATETLF